MPPSRFPPSPTFSDSSFDYQVLTNHAVENQATQTLNGGSLGLTASVGRGGFFSDSLVKVDLTCPGIFGPVIT
jgi:hypothetical protein